jgi:hypothetical protein
MIHHDRQQGLQARKIGIFQVEIEAVLLYDVEL